MDTHALIWWLNGDEKLGQFSREQIGLTSNKIFVSAASVWEMAIKQQMGKLKTPTDIQAVIEQAGFHELAISLFHGQQAGGLPLHHKDPFDRMLIAQAQSEGMHILTKDEHFPKYCVKLINACE